MTMAGAAATPAGSSFVTVMAKVSLVNNASSACAVVCTLYNLHDTHIQRVLILVEQYQGVSGH